MKRIAYTSPYIPPEWIAAHGWEPVFYVPKGTKSLPSIGNTMGMCAYMRVLMNELYEDATLDAIITTTLCDQMRRGVDEIKTLVDIPCFLFNIPTTRASKNASSLYQQELHRLSNFLVAHGGTDVQEKKLRTLMHEYEETRSHMLTRYGNGNNETLSAIRINQESSYKKSGNRGDQKIPLGIIGAEIVGKDCEIFDIITNAGGTITIDGLEYGERTMPALFDKRLINEDPFFALCTAYFETIPGIFQRPNTTFYQWLDRMIKRYPIKGMILVRYIWCDTWHGEALRLKKWLPVPLIDIDIDGTENYHRSKMRIEAFIESFG